MPVGDVVFCRIRLLTSPSEEIATHSTPVLGAERVRALNRL